MRTPSKIKEHIAEAIIEEINKAPNLLKEPENVLPHFIEQLANHLTELCLDEISFSRR